MYQYLRLRSGSERIFKPMFKIFPIIKKDVQSTFKFPVAIKNKKLKVEEETKPFVQDQVLLYEYDRSKYFKKIKFFSLCNFVIWTLFGINLYDTLAIEPKLYDGELKQKWVENKKTRDMTQKLIVITIVIGFLFVLTIWFYIMRNVKQIHLIKSTKSVKFETYSFYPETREFTVPLNQVSGVSRHSVKGYVPIKIKNTLFYFLVDLNGNFPDVFLFDNSVGCKRDLKNYG